MLASHYFPPYSHPGIRRPLKFAKYLPDFGYKPKIITCGNIRWRSYDYSLYESEVERKMDVYRIDARGYRSIGARSLGTNVIRQLVMKIESAAFEDRLDWALSSIGPLQALLKEGGVRIVVTTGPPQSTHFMGYYAKKRCGLPWIMDFRDPMVTNISTLGVGKARSLIEKIKKKTLFTLYERTWVKTADWVISVTEGMTKDFQIRYPRHAGKMVTITNGFDSEDFKGLGVSRVQDGKFYITHTGRFWSRRPHDFLKGLELALLKYPRLKQSVRVRLVGEIENGRGRDLEKFPFSEVIITHGMVDHRNALSRQLESDVNLVIVPWRNGNMGRHILTSKIFEYLRAGRPILAIGFPGLATDFVEGNGLGYTAKPDDPGEIAKSIYELFQEWERGNLDKFRAPESLLTKYESRNLTEHLCNCINSCL
jgi:glycosyltransferase involved in cell wall biosynthesis